MFVLRNLIVMKIKKYQKSHIGEEKKRNSEIYYHCDTCKLYVEKKHIQDITSG